MEIDHKRFYSVDDSYKQGDGERLWWLSGRYTQPEAVLTNRSQNCIINLSLLLASPCRVRRLKLGRGRNFVPKLECAVAQHCPAVRTQLL